MTTVKRREREYTADSRYRPCVIGIDQSYGGFAISVLYRNSHDYDLHLRGFPADKCSGVDRLCIIGAWIESVLRAQPLLVEHVCMEDYAPNSKFGREMAGELGAVVKLALRTSPLLRSPTCYPTIVATTSLKKYVTGKGTSAKSDMKLHVYKRWGVECKTDDQADSYGLARIAAAIQWKSEDLLEYQKDALKNIRHHTERQE